MRKSRDQNWGDRSIMSVKSIQNKQDAKDRFLTTSSLAYFTDKPSEAYPSRLHQWTDYFDIEPAN